MCFRIRGAHMRFIFQTLIICAVSFTGFVANTKTTEGNRILNQAILANDVGAVKQTLQLKVDVNAPSEQGVYAIHAAAQPNVKEEILALLLSAGADPNVRDFNGQSALHISVKGKSLNKIKFLVSGGAQINERNRTGYPALLIAVLRFDPSAAMVRTLLDLGADQNIVHLNHTPLQFAQAMLNYFKTHSPENALAISEAEKIVAMLL